MTSDLDIYRAAKVLIDQHGLKGASEHTAERITALPEKGDDAGARTWGKIRAALLDLSDVRFRGDGVHWDYRAPRQGAHRMELAGVNKKMLSLVVAKF